MTYIVRLFIVFGLFLLLPTPCRCQSTGHREYELLLPNGLQQGQSLSIRPFTLNELAPYHYNQESLQEVQNAMASNLQEVLGHLGRFTRVIVISESDTPATDLILEGTFSRIDQGNRLGRVFLYSPATMRVSGVFKRVAGDESILWVHCVNDRLGGLLGNWSPPGVAFHIPNKSGKTLIHECTKQISKDMVKIIKKAEQKPASGKPVTKW